MVGLILLAAIARVSLSADLVLPESLTIGDRFALRARLVHPSDLPVSPPFLDSLGSIAFLSVDSTREEAGDSVKRTYEFEAAAFATGEIAIPPLRVAYVEGEEEMYVQSDSLTLTVTSVLPEDMREIRDIKPIFAFPSYLWMYLLGGFVLAVILAFLALRFLRKRRLPEETLLPPEPPWKAALDALMRLPFSEWRREGAFKAYYFALSDVLKRYLEGRYGFAAAEETTSEILMFLRERKIPVRDEVREFFEGADSVKYAKRAPSDREMETAYDDVRGLVERTALKSEETEGGEE
jgi:hypothetical protein